MSRSRRPSTIDWSSIDPDVLEFLRDPTMFEQFSSQPRTRRGGKVPAWAYDVKSAEGPFEQQGPMTPRTQLASKKRRSPRPQDPYRTERRAETRTVRGETKTRDAPLFPARNCPLKTVRYGRENMLHITKPVQLKTGQTKRWVNCQQSRDVQQECDLAEQQGRWCRDPEFFDIQQ